MWAGCVPYRTYPLLTVSAPGSHRPLEPSGLAVLDDGRVVMVAEGDAHALLVPDPDQPVAGGGVLDLLPLRDGREDCRDHGNSPAGTPARVRCERRHYRASIRLREEPITWLPRERMVTLPYNVEDLAPFGPDRVLGITEFSTIGRKTGYRADYTVRSRRQTERLFVLERDGKGGWVERELPEVERLREMLSDWGRGTCGDDMLVEGLAYDPIGQDVYVGLRRCDGPVQRVLHYHLGGARGGRAVGIEVAADGIDGATAGPTEGISGLAWADGRLWALTAWDSFGYDVEAAFGGRLHEVRDGRLHPVPLPGPFLDRPSALALLPGPSGADTIVLFDNDAAARQPGRPTATVLRARIPRPADEQFVQARELVATGSDLPLGLNGFDLRWYARDHRLSQLAAILAIGRDGEPGGWTRALGGLWQMRIGGSLGLIAARLPFLGRSLGHDRQAVALTDYRGTDLRFTSYRARLTVVPRDRERQNPSVARLLDDVRPAYRAQVTLPTRASADAGLVLQGFEIDTTARADRGVCLAALELGVDWAGDYDQVAVQSTLVGGLCNDFDTRGTDLRHGRTTDIEGGVDVIVYFAVVEGGRASRWSAGIFDRDRPGARDGAGGYVGDPDRGLDDATAQAHLHCGTVDATGALTRIERGPPSPPAAWLSQGAVWAPPDVAVGPVLGASLRGFAVALDPRGFDPAIAAQPMSEVEALNRNNYIHRYLVRAFPIGGGPTAGGGTLVDGGVTHGIHRGLLKDNQRPSALLLRADLTGFAGSTPAPTGDSVWPRRATDPNLLPEDGYIRWAPVNPGPVEPGCAPP